jgi:thymidylate kinase
VPALARELDRRLPGRALVFGSLPGSGRDLDLLLREEEHAHAAACLRQAGFLARGRQWVHFHERGAVAAELVPAADWRLPAAELEALFAEGAPISGYVRLITPAPPQALLIVARRVARCAGLPDRLRDRVGAALAQDPEAWSAAGARARAWHAQAALELLQRRYEDRPDPGGLVLRARAELARAALRDPGWALGRIRRRPPLAGPAVIALSGLDGAGKSTQARALQRRLAEAGITAEVLWPPARNRLFGMNPKVKSTLRALLERVSTGTGEAEPRSPAEARAAEPVLEPLPRQSAPVAHGLALIVALAQAMALRSAVRGAPAGAEVVICDRYALDSIVYLRSRWGTGRPLALQSKLIHRLAPGARRTFLLELAPELAYARKQDYPLDVLRERFTLYRELAPRLGAEVLDASSPARALTEQIARHAWLALG